MMRRNFQLAVLTLTALCGTVVPALAETGTPPAQAPATAKYSSSTTTLGTLMADPAAKAILVRIVPEMGATSGMSENLERASGMTLRELKDAVGAYAPDMLSDARLTALDLELAKLPASQ